MLETEPTKLNKKAFFLEPLVRRIHSIPGALNSLKIEYVVNGKWEKDLILSYKGRKGLGLRKTLMVHPGILFVGARYTFEVWGQRGNIIISKLVSR